MNPTESQYDMPDPAVELLRMEILRKMGPSARFESGLRLIRMARDLKESRIASLHPDWSPDQVRRETARIFLHAVA
jgi:hypothetical protein